MVGFLTGVLAAIQLVGVTGSDLRARAFFDANNVKVGDPLILTVDFIGAADFKDLHPPALAKCVDRKDWKLDDASSKTDTFSDARRLVYRVRPMREGVLWFPALEFEYAGPDGQPRIVRANGIPVHAKGGAQVVVSEMSETEENALPKPPELIREPPAALTDDARFAWRRALSKPTAAAFLAFDFPEAKMNAATCAIRDGNWADALKLYQRVEWSIGQTPEVERGIVAALALRHDNPAVELPVWRQVLRPLLRFGWRGRVGLVLGGFAALALFFWLLGRGIKAVACLAVAVALAATAQAETIETVTTNADGSVTVTKVVKNGSFSYTSSSTTGGTGGGRMTGGAGSLFDSDPFEMFAGFDPFGRTRKRANLPKPTFGIALAPDKPSVTVGEDFNLILTLEYPRYVSISEGLQLSLTEQDKLQQIGEVQRFQPQKGRNPTNIIQRLAFPMRAIEPFAGLHYSVASAYTYANDRSFFRQATPFASGPRVARLTAKPLPPAGRPADFGGIISEGLRLHETCDLLRVETNDVVTITYRLIPKGYVPANFLPKDAAFEWQRQQDGHGRIGEIVYRRYFVADGAPATPPLEVSYYDPRAKAYRTARTGGTKLLYTAAREP